MRFWILTGFDFYFFYKNKQQSHNLDYTHHLSLNINKILRTFYDQINSVTFQVGWNPVTHDADSTSGNVLELLVILTESKNAISEAQYWAIRSL